MRVTDTASFITKSKIVHGDRYDYSDTIYVNARTKLEISCREHGYFRQSPRTHIKQESGCPSCGGTKKLNNEEFKKRCNAIHNFKYNYDNTLYESMSKYILISCPHHGEFRQQAVEHYRGHGCSKCGRMSSGFGKIRFIKACKKNNKEGFLYLIKCTSETEAFYKVGITSKTVKSRTVNIPYESEILSVLRMDAIDVFMGEKMIHKKLKEFSYIPLKSFCGFKECFSELTDEVKEFFGVNDA